MKVAVFGLGYVGSVTATCLADLGHTVVGVDLNETKVAQINRGDAPMVEPGLAERLQRAVGDGRLRAVSQAREAMTGVNVALLCVGTPSCHTGALDYRHLARVIDELRECLAVADTFPVVAVRSTVLPGIVHRDVVSRLEQSGLRAGRDFGVCVNPEFLREGTAVADFLAPPLTLIGELEPSSGDVLEELYAPLGARVVRTDLETASMVKYASNAYHALKVVFANEMGALCHSRGIDGRAVMDVFCLDTKLNVSASYLKPGFAFGGSCLPKDLRALLHDARHADVDLPVLNAVFPSNNVHIERALELITRMGVRRIGVAGLSFKTNTDDLRESPLVILIERLIGKGLDVHVYDAEVSLSRVFGRNREYIDRAIPHITALMCDTLDDLIDRCDVIVVGKRIDGIEAALEGKRQSDQTVVDLAGMWPHQTATVGDRSIARIC